MGTIAKPGLRHFPVGMKWVCEGDEHVNVWEVHDRASSSSLSEFTSALDTGLF